MQATIFIPVLSLIALVLKAVFGVEIGEETIHQVADILVTVTLGIIALIGIFKTYSKKVKDAYEEKKARQHK